MIVTLTDSGKMLKDRAASVSQRLGACVEFDAQKIQILYALLYEVLNKLAQ